ncbi:RnfH family protein [Saccharophagus sp. K07]|jgi:putative ubiquitin-RnfH superfamily antitoxin RatB of RatAB toxin-antitoxin module|uniref:RnfH family protein n=1 Tax=Saccharophagus sp. K07 TaxID=2283636 RepID=UPI001652352D|nr:RnfH family protein [Saccharophagus sp. K07]MBC6904227.1 RnfH family protein [Saccharophagus sp. K07]
MSDIESISVEVVYALPHKQKIISLLVEPGTTAYQAAVKSDITQHFPDLDLENAPMGIFGQTLGTKGLAPAKQYVLQAGDRVEIYRPLTSDPKEARRKRAAKSASAEE